MSCPKFRTAEDYRDHLPCQSCEPAPSPPLPNEADVIYIRDWIQSIRIPPDVIQGLAQSHASARSEEREACAKIADEMVESLKATERIGIGTVAQRIAARTIAARIRLRGEPGP